MPRNLSNLDVSWFLDLHSKGQLDLNPPYQRRSVWSPRDKRFFIDTILNNYPAPPVFLHKTLNEQGTPTYHVVDGKQRLQTIIEFTQNKVRIPDDFANVELRKKRWSDLQRETRELFWNYVLIVENLPDVSESAIKDIFERINRNSRKLMRQEMRHAKYDGWFVSRSEAEAEKEEWRTLGVVTNARIKRMADVQFISELLAVVINKGLSGFDQDALDDLYAAYEDLEDHPDLIEDDFNQAVTTAKAYVLAMLDQEPGILDHFKVQTHFYSLWSYLLFNQAVLTDAATFAPQYRSFMEEVTAIQGNAAAGPPADPTPAQMAAWSYAGNSRGATTELPQRQGRDAALKMRFGETPRGEDQ